MDKILGSVDNSSSKGLRPATLSRDPEILPHEQVLNTAYTYLQNQSWELALEQCKTLLNVDPNHVLAWHFSGMANAKLRNWPQAIQDLEKALNLEASAERHLQLATLYTEVGNPSQALQHYHQALQLEPDSVSLHYQLGLFFLRQHNYTAAETQFNNVRVLYPEHFKAWFYLGILHLHNTNLMDAELAFQRVLSLVPDDIESLVNLGVIALKRDQGQIAINWFTQALARNPNHLEALNNLAATFMHHDRFENALVYYNELLKNDPNNGEYLYNAGVAEMTLGNLTAATVHFEHLLTHVTPEHFAALSNLASIQLRLGKRDNAITLLTHALQIQPEDQTTKFMLTALTGNNIATTACLPYVENLFDNYAMHYENHLQKTLHYAIPKHIARILHQHIAINSLKTLDLGCGTGLSGSVLRELSTHLTGVDLSAKMLTIALKKNIYDKLVTQDILTFLQEDSDSYDLAVAADVLPYFGDLTLLFSQLAKRLNPGGHFLMSIEISLEKPVELQNNMRFCHHPKYITDCANMHGFYIQHAEKQVARQQNKENLEVMLYFLQKPA